MQSHARAELDLCTSTTIFSPFLLLRTVPELHLNTLIAVQKSSQEFKRFIAGGFTFCLFHFQI